MAEVHIHLDREDLQQVADRLLERLQQSVLGGVVIARQLTLSQVQDVLQMPASSVYELLKHEDDPLPARRFGDRRVRVDARQFSSWLERHPYDGGEERLEGMLDD